LVPSQIVVLDGLLETETDGATVAVTVMVMILLVASVGLGQVELLVIRHLTVFPSAKVEVVYVALFVPTFDPLTCH
jgi:hypothetical protein